VSCGIRELAAVSDILTVEIEHVNCAALEVLQSIAVFAHQSCLAAIYKPVWSHAKPYTHGVERHSERGASQRGAIVWRPFLTDPARWCWQAIMGTTPVQPLPATVRIIQVLKMISEDMGRRVLDLASGDRRLHESGSFGA
jgi:hypothetical protein